MAATSPKPKHPYRKTFDQLRSVMNDPASTPEQKRAALDAAEEIVDNLLASLPDDSLAERVRILREPRIPRTS